MLVKVTQKHIDKGERQMENSCPIALAVNECFGYDPADQRVFVDQAVIQLLDDNGEVVKEMFTDSSIDDFIADFDEGHEVKPFEFHFESRMGKV